MRQKWCRAPDSIWLHEKKMVQFWQKRKRKKTQYETDSTTNSIHIVASIRRQLTCVAFECLARFAIHWEWCIRYKLNHGWTCFTSGSFCVHIYFLTASTEYLVNHLFFFGITAHTHCNVPFRWQFSLFICLNTCVWVSHSDTNKKKTTAAAEFSSSHRILRIFLLLWFPLFYFFSMLFVWPKSNWWPFAR